MTIGELEVGDVVLYWRGPRKEGQEADGRGVVTELFGTPGVDMCQIRKDDDGTEEAFPTRQVLRVPEADR